ncbi:carboxylating nicotinate-nucleotide diphosphorylase [Candidatus Bathyarchaeota archaeon]|nr:carboxylating nicotinate-nucleotide diphosphorylase [Candidatus Bathyarchaeota archaeon]MBL7167865.1 carboxylating nicotinate-nucleotide diphosphorylase [Candidatus Bathyarchaeota archaeon]
MGAGFSVEERLREFLKDDIGWGDITSEALIDDGQIAKGRLYFREDGVAAGLDEVTTIFHILGCEVNAIERDGSSVSRNQTLMEISGPAKALLAGERTALNILGRMAGIATAVSKIASQVSKVSQNTKVAATRKTMPGLGELDKKAVALGGGDTHRFRLDDCVLIKDNHLALLPSITEAVKAARSAVSFTKKIEIEIESLEGAVEAAKAGADIIMFDNMPPEEIERCLARLSELGLREGRVYEASGGITPENVGDYAASGVDIISMGSLTHSVRALDVKLEIEMVKKE